MGSSSERDWTFASWGKDIKPFNRTVSIAAENMPQKPLTNKGKRSLPRLGAANRHGKVIKHKKG